MRIICQVIISILVLHMRAEASITIIQPSMNELLGTNMTKDSLFRISHTSFFKFYGKLKGDDSINGSAIVMEGRQICWPPRELVEGKIVVAVRENHFCDLEDSYKALSDRGALAFISITAMLHPGIFCYRHQSWDPWALADNKLVLVEATKYGFVLAADGRVDSVDGAYIERRFNQIIEAWAAESDMRLLIGQPFDTFYQEAYESMWWTMTLRVLMPIYALYTSAFATLQSLQYHKRGSEWAPGRVICFVEGPIMFFIATALACGLYVCFH